MLTISAYKIALKMLKTFAKNQMGLVLALCAFLIDVGIYIIMATLNVRNILSSDEAFAFIFLGIAVTFVLLWVVSDKLDNKYHIF